MLINRLSRDVSLKIHFILDQLIPPLLRDQWWFMALPMRMVFGHRAPIYRRFKDYAYGLSDEEFRGVYEQVSDTAIQRETDLNQASIEAILAYVKGPKVLDAGSGRGYLTRVLSERGDYQVSGVDILVPEVLRQAQPNVSFSESSLEHLPYADKQFDTVICAHTLEHVRDVASSIRELRRVGTRLIIVLPKQRPYKYTFDLHLNFFPYLHTVPAMMGTQGKDIICDDRGGDIFYMEDVEDVEDMAVAKQDTGGA